MDLRTKRLRDLFEKSGLTQSEVCNKTNINKGALSSYLSGRYFPKQKALEQLAAVFNVSIEYLMGMNTSHFKESLIEIRKARGFTQQVMANYLHITKENYAAYESGTAIPSTKTIIDIVAILDISYEELLSPFNEEEKAILQKIESSDYSSSIISEFQKHGSAVNLLQGELDLIAKYRDLDYYGKQAINGLIENELERCEKFPAQIKCNSLIQIPYYHQLASAGNGEYLFDDLPTDTIRIDKTTEAEKADFVLKVRGDSMEPNISDGELLLVKKTPEINTGEIGIFIDQYDCYVKELGKNGLISHNKKYPLMIPANGVRCIGRVLGKAKEV